MKKTRARDRGIRAMPAPEANAELQSNIDVSHLLFTEQYLYAFAYVKPL